jgi:hypothetical protein
MLQSVDFCTLWRLERLFAFFPSLLSYQFIDDGNLLKVCKVLFLKIST